MASAIFMNQKKILIVDDDEFLRKIYAAELTKQGYQVTEAVNGEDGWHKIELAMPDLVLLDIIMPKKNGFELLAQSRRESKSAALPVIMFSNLAQPEDKERASKLGATAYIVKGEAQPETVVQQVDKLLQPDGQTS